MYGYPMSMLPQEFADLNRAERMEKARRLSRYDEAIRLLREIASYEPLSDSDGGFVNTWNEIEVFLAALAPAKEECTPHNHHWSWGRCLDCTQPDTAPPSEVPEAVGPVARAIDALITASEYYEDEESIAVCVQAAEDLEFWWRSQPAPADDQRYRKSIAQKLGMRLEDYNGVPALCDIETFVHRQPAPAIRMTEELARLIQFVENNIENRCGEIRHEMPRVIAAVRAQAAAAGKRGE